MTALPKNRRRHNRQAAQMVEVVAAWTNYEGNRRSLQDVVVKDLADGGLGIECQDYLTPGDVLGLRIVA